MKSLYNYAITALFILTLAPSAWADKTNKKITLSKEVPEAVRTAINSALAINKKAKAAHVEWLWARPLNNMWEGRRQDNSEILIQVIKMANSGNNEQAIKTARFIENAARQGLIQAEKAKKAEPFF